MKVKTAGSVLCYNFEKAKLDKLSEVCKKQGIRIKAVPESEYGTSIGNALGFMTSEPDDTKDIAFADEMMVMYNISGTALDKFLMGMRESSIAIPLKAVLTASNQSWLPSALCEELKREHEKMNS